MVARTRSEPELLATSFSRDGENDEAKIVASPERAAVTAVLMIAGRGSLHAGICAALQQGRLTVTALRIKDVTAALHARRYRQRKNGKDISASVTVRTLWGGSPDG